MRLGRLRERKIGQWAVAYLAGAWLVYEAANLVGDNFGWPTLALRLLAVVLACGLPLVLVLAWYHGEQGRQRVSAPELLMIAGILVVAAVSVSFVAGPRTPRPAADTGSAAVAASAVDDASLAVLPFVNMSSDAEQEYFSDGLTEELLNVLARHPDLRVASRTSAFSFKGKDVRIDSVARALNVAHVVEGSVRRDGDKIRITAQLIRAQTGYHLWSDTYDRQFSNIFVVQEEIAEAIAAVLRVRLVPGADLVRRSTGDVDAYNLYLQARYSWAQRSEASVQRAIELFNQALALDSAYARAYAGLADAHIIRGNWNWAAPEQAYPRAETLARRAVALDSTLAEAHTSLGGIALWYRYDAAAADASFRRALELNPDYVYAHYWYSIFLTKAGRHDEALARASRARELDPLAPQLGIGVSDVYYFSRNYDRALEELRRTMEVDPLFPNSYFRLSRALSSLRRFPEAEAALARKAQLTPDNLATDLAQLYARWGRRDDALRELAAGERARDYVPAVEWARVHALTGDHEQALQLLQRARDANASNLWELAVDPDFDALRPNPRFRALLRSLRVPS
jgi:adenylate cyclase